MFYMVDSIIRKFLHDIGVDGTVFELTEGSIVQVTLKPSTHLSGLWFDYDGEGISLISSGRLSRIPNYEILGIEFGEGGTIEITLGRKVMVLKS